MYITQINLDDHEIVVDGYCMSTERVEFTRTINPFSVINIDLILAATYYDYVYMIYKEADNATIDVVYDDMKLRFKVLQVREISLVNDFDPDTRSTLIKVSFRCEEDSSTRDYLYYNF